MARVTDRKKTEPKTGLAALGLPELQRRLSDEQATVRALAERGVSHLRPAQQPAVLEQAREHAKEAQRLQAEIASRPLRRLALPERVRGRARNLATSGSGDAGVLAKAQAELRAKDAEERALAPPPDVPVRDGWDAVLPVLPDNLAELGRRELGHLQVAHEEAQKLLRRRRGGLGEHLTDEQRRVEEQIAEAELEILAGHVSGRWTRRDELLRQKLSRELDALLRTATSPPPKPRKIDPKAASISAAVAAFLIDGPRSAEFVFGGLTPDGKRNVAPALNPHEIGLLLVIYGLIARGEPDANGLVDLQVARRGLRVDLTGGTGIWAPRQLERLARTKLLRLEGSRVGYGPAALALAKKAGVRLPDPAREAEQVLA